MIKGFYTVQLAAHGIKYKMCINTCNMQTCLQLQNNALDKETLV